MKKSIRVCLSIAAIVAIFTLFFANATATQAKTPNDNQEPPIIASRNLIGVSGSKYKGGYIKNGNALYDLPLYLRDTYLDKRKMPRESVDSRLERASENLRKCRDALSKDPKVWQVASFGPLTYITGHAFDVDEERAICDVSYPSNWKPLTKSELQTWDNYIDCFTMLTLLDGSQVSLRLKINGKFADFRTSGSKVFLSKIAPVVSEVMYTSESGGINLVSLENGKGGSFLYLQKDMRGKFKGEIVGWASWTTLNPKPVHSEVNIVPVYLKFPE